LRQQDGSYSHWGLSRVHGEVAAQKALTEAHHGLVSRILKTPLRNLIDDVKQSSSAKNFEEKDFLDNLESREPSLVPAQPGVGLKRHLSSVLHALAALAKHRR
jgi:hypothetical protein